MKRCVRIVLAGTHRFRFMSTTLLLYLNRLIYERLHPHKTRTEESLYQNIATYIEEHLEEDLSLQKLAEEFFVSKYHIAHIFKDNLGLSIHQYITKKRLALCREAILGQMSITEAYHTFGFGDYSSFYRAFKKEYGISPKDFRDMQKEISRMIRPISLNGTLRGDLYIPGCCPDGSP